MSVYYYEPFFSFNDFHRLFDDAWSSRGASGDRQLQRTDSGQNQVARGFQPKMDIHESAEANTVTATIELPGLKKEDVTIDVRNNRLVVSGESTISKGTNENGFVHRERQTGKFSRTLPLPAGTKPTDIKASMENGVLSVTFPKSSPEQAPQKIAIA